MSVKHFQKFRLRAMTQREVAKYRSISKARDRSKMEGDSNRLRPLNTNIGTRKGRGRGRRRRSDAIATKETQLHRANNFDEQRINHERRRKGVLASASYDTNGLSRWKPNYISVSAKTRRSRDSIYGERCRSRGTSGYNRVSVANKNDCF